ncbi:MAG: ABC transporter ATP-binding protein [Rhodobacteraceae bacterium]|nr:ABC transporter ATP-binding protein [Paracoccaceae bacterium]
MTFSETDSPLLEVRDLAVRFDMLRRTIHAVNGLSFKVRAGETFAIVGESGCGKSVTALALLKLLAMPPARISRGSVLFEGQDLMQLPESKLRQLRGPAISYVFQEPMSSLNPSMKIGRQIAEACTLHYGMNRDEALARARELMEMVQLPDAEERLSAYPHQLSGGMRQRTMIAIALACSPRLLVADEPTTALDVTIQAQILDLLSDLQSKTGTGMILITHDLAVVAEYADRMMVMYAGCKVEEGPVDEILDQPRHPYTLGLLQAVPRLGSSLQEGPRRSLEEIKGVVPILDAPSVGCPFAPRCSLAIDICRREMPRPASYGNDHHAACFRGEQVGASD